MIILKSAMKTAKFLTTKGFPYIINFDDESCNFFASKVLLYTVSNVIFLLYCSLDMVKILQQQQQLNKVIIIKYTHSFLHVFISFSDDMTYTPGICLLSSNERSVSVLTPQYLKHMFVILAVPVNIHEATEISQSQNQHSKSKLYIAVVHSIIYHIRKRP